MIINLNVKVKGGKRTPVEVSVYGTSVNPKRMEFKNGNSITDDQIAEMIEKNVTSALKSIQNEIAPNRKIKE